MKQLAQYQDGRLEQQEVPAPVAPPGGILVRTTCSVISPGTERMKVEQARMSLLQKAKARPDQVKKVIDTAKTLGWKAAMEKVRNRLESPTPLGYSAAGVVVAVDELNTRFRVGDRVACGGAECAFHAEMIAVPDLLAVPIPEGVEDWQGAYTTLASISMEAVRQSGARLGERVLVMGQGLVGLLATSLLKASGARVMSADFVAGRLETALNMGAERVVNPAQSKLEDEVRAWTCGHGVDAVLLCVGGKGRDAADSAIACLRDRGVMVIVGIYDAELSWKTAYLKDIQVRYSRSYGPGRYDLQYEWGGQDYPIGHVRWTENRNFEACLELMRTGQLDLRPVTTRRVGFEDVLGVYDQLESELGVVIEYGGGGSIARACRPDEAEFPKCANERLQSGVERLDVIGAGNFARTMLLPHVKGPMALGTIVNATGLSARHVKEKFGFAHAETDAAKVLEGGTADAAVMIGTRHHLHAAMVLKALKAGRQVFVEKPLCLTQEELGQIDAAVVESKGSVMVGFNRRFAPATVVMMEVLSKVSGPKTLAFHVNAGVLAPDHWYANVAESGGRVLGEACHFFDFACHVLGRPVKVTAQTVGRPKVPDSVTAQIEYADGSAAQVVYSAEGDVSYPKETFRVFASGLVVECENFMKLSVFKQRKTTVRKYASKGHAEEMAAWLAYLKGVAVHPLPYEEARQSMKLTFAVLESIREGRSIEL
ncbi:bi-domain-containing oxidoreductase [Prosthecobacter vanneervenii]|uniref:Putative dehydrogenase/threonine dehydrogenase-like Zn-dependent dehydrogenase n=1 Tax=Prosthecobacter vanneervenii TaxID=48466 RepID=A0A7W7YF62_9BACT|nr:bi-domain-containing oxidoreductase [Prosthecobacter vanneervenii]MBB5035038.1 putative dehydrogenase/threonine dehydrogenase-like Zn-dependent dehydrogenase [Prosthecobacter vanneervenii]